MRILIVEDDRQLRASMARGLREASHSVDSAATGAKAIALASATAYDVMVLDVRLPDLDGLAVCRAQRWNQKRQRVL
jgi:two-component system OmpR family response regulator